jgi:LysM repeat protein
VRVGGPALFLAAVTAAVLLVRPALVPTRSADLRSTPPARHSLRAAPAAPARFTIVESGDTLGAIAQRFHTTVRVILDLNPGIDPRALHAGQHVVLP